MKINLLNTSRGLVPMYDYDYDEKKKLRIGEVYCAEVRLQRNYEFLKKYFALINCAWEYLTEPQAEFYKNKEIFRKIIEVVAGHCEKWYSPELKKWVEIPKSISFDKMDNAEFQDLYSRVLDVIIISLKIDREEFERNISNFL